MNDAARELAEKAVRRLAENHAERDQRRHAARTYVRTLFAAHPKLKLPELLKLEETKELMAKLDVSKNMLAEELTHSRTELKAKEAERPVKVPRKTRQRGDANNLPAKVPQLADSSAEFLPLAGGALMPLRG